MTHTRRDFVKQTTAATATIALTTPFALGSRGQQQAGDKPTIGIGVVGTGGRGTGACNDCLSSNYDVKLVAMGEVRRSSAERAREALKGHADKVAVPDENIFVGLDAYKQVINHPDVDVVILTTPPGFRPMHIAEAVAAKKHIFAEKPVCVDATGYRSCLESAAKAKAQGTAIVTGTQYRRQPSYMEGIKRIHNGEIGDLTGGLSYYCSTGIWYRPREDGMTDAEYQVKNWYHFLWTCGDQICEQAVHNLDAVNWIMGGPPVKAFGHGGQMTRPADSEIYDHMSIDYEYANGALISFKCRQIPGSAGRVINTIVGTKGRAYINPMSSHVETLSGEELFHYEGRGNNPYQQEHRDLVASIRAGNPIVELEETANSSLTAVMGRLAAYSGQEVTWDFMLNSKEDLMPKNLSMDMSLPEPKVAIPGQTPLI